MSLLELAGVDVAYGDLPALRGVTLVVEAGETLSVVGANGAGKTTMRLRDREPQRLRGLHVDH